MIDLNYRNMKNLLIVMLSICFIYSCATYNYTKKSDEKQPVSPTDNEQTSDHIEGTSGGNADTDPDDQKSKDHHYTNQKTEPAKKDVIAVLKFSADPACIQNIVPVNIAMKNYLLSNMRYKLLENIDSINTWYPDIQPQTANNAELQILNTIALKLNANYIIIGKIQCRNNLKTIEGKLFSVKHNKIIFDTKASAIPSSMLADTAKTVIGRLILMLNGTLPRINNFEASMGGSYDKIELKWDCTRKADAYLIYRGILQWGPFTKLTSTAEKKFIDTTAEPGIRYWYKIAAELNGIESEQSSSTGYRKPQNPRGLTVDEAIGPRTKNWIEPWDAAEKARQKLWLPYWETYHESYIVASLFFLIGRRYVNSGELLIYKDFDNYYMDWDTRVLYLRKNNLIEVSLFSGRLVRFVNNFEKKSGVKKEISLDHIIKNGLFYSLRSGEREYPQKDGTIRYVPYFESIGVSTEYLKDYKKWRSNSIVFGTYDKKLRKRLFEAYNKGY